MSYQTSLINVENKIHWKSKVHQDTFEVSLRFFLMFLNEDSSTHQGYLIKNTGNTVIVWMKNYYYDLK